MIIELNGKNVYLDFHYDFRYKGIIPNGFETHCTIKEHIKDSICLYSGSAFLHPNDNPSKVVGRKIALSRAIATLPKEERTKIWAQYKEKCRYR